MTEFRLPDGVRELRTVETQLRQELVRRQSDLNLVKDNLPKWACLHKTPAYRSMMVAHRKWQHAYEKLHILHLAERA